jgi:hypothetical protein
MKKSQNMMVGLSKQNGFGSAFSHTLLRLVKGIANPNSYLPAGEECKQGGVSHYDLAIYIIKKYLKAKEELL